MPKLRLVGFDASVPGVTPVPDRAIVSVELGAFEVIVTSPLEVPADVGVNVTVKVALCPAVSVTGAVIPLRLKPVPVTAAWEIVTVAPPVLVTVSEIDCLLPSVTLPKLRLEGFDPRSPGEIPAPDKAIVNVGLDPVEVMVTVPLALPADVGVNITLKVVLCPAASVTGAVIPLRLKPVPVIAS